MRTSISIIISVLCLLCSCCKDDLSVAPDKRISIYNGDSYYIYYDGLKVLPKYRNQLISHTTFRIDDWNDDRLCAINLETGKADWYFPSDLSKAYKCAFDGFSHMYDNYLVFKYIENSTHNSQGTVVCMNLDTKEVVWKITESDKSGYANTNICGFGSKIFFDENKRKLYCLDLETQEVKLIYESGEFEIRHFKISDDGELYIFKDRDIENPEDVLGYYIINKVVILDQNSGAEKFCYEIKPFEGTGARWIAGNGIIQDGILYANVDTYLTAVDIKTGHQLWERDDPEAYILQDLIVCNGVVLKCGINATYGYDAQTGMLLYKYDNFGSHYTTQNGKYAYLITRSGWLAVIDIATGRIHKRIDCPDEMFFGSYPTFYGDKMYIMGLPNYLYCYSVDKMER